MLQTLKIILITILYLYPVFYIVIFISLLTLNLKCKDYIKTISGELVKVLFEPYILLIAHSIISVALGIIFITLYDFGFVKYYLIITGVILLISSLISIRYYKKLLKGEPKL